ncbi:ADP-ribosylation factor-like protein 13B [Ischnura elegans]|uniref:ADP-ribosylation factor-like protein 13B n=1 Tax=Ischnura elegans TaxID=197161 RepID=UPI001ED86C5A|nr:ADP-ribosylation factor-like protein 13B [Ischnura elegans]XP_046392902.1 ADP-ribosylation factor-like protein 13B [Ischnura elegans]
MGNCNCMRDCLNRCVRRPAQKKVVLLLLGLENAGKTTVAKGLAHELVNGVVPTVGFSSVTLEYKKYSVVLYDLGGGPGIRAIWHKYFVDAHGMIFVLDSSDIDKVAECRDVLRNLLSNEKLCGKPLLVLGNKQDVEGALDEIDIVEMLHLEDLVNQQKCPTLVETCSAVALSKSHFKDDQVIQNSFKWLLSLIERDYDDLNSRVEKDMLEQKEIDQAEYKEKVKRVKEARLSREGGSIDVDFGENLPQVEGDVVDDCGKYASPFKPINELLNGQGDNMKRSTEAINDALDGQFGAAPRKKQLHRQNGISEDMINGSRHTRNRLNCFCMESSVGSEANLLKSTKRTSSRPLSLWKNNKTVPIDNNGDSSRENTEQVWAIRLPSNDHPREENAIVSIPEAFTVCHPVDNNLELDDFTGMRGTAKSGVFQAMKG